jgi:hypothetical protein
MHLWLGLTCSAPSCFQGHKHKLYYRAATYVTHGSKLSPCDVGTWPVNATCRVSRPMHLTEL